MRNPLLLPELKELLEERRADELRDFCSSVHPAEAADFLSALSPQEIWDVLSLLDTHIAAEIFANLEIERQVELANFLSRGSLAQLITSMSSDDRADLLKKLPEHVREALLPALAQVEREDIRRLTSYREGTAGSVMTSEYVALPPDITVAEAIEKLRREAPDKETIYYSYVVDSSRRLIGFVSLKNLILAKPDEKVENIMQRNVIFAHVDEDREEAARKIAKYDLIALPVVNGGGALVGIITHDDALDVLSEEYSEDMEKFMAITGSHEGGYLRTPAWLHFKNRAYWVTALAALGLVSGLIIHRFESTLVNLVILALYMPMVADTGGNTGSQAATVVVRALALREITPRDAFRVLWKELRVSVLLAGVLGVLTYFKVVFLSSSSEIPTGFSLELIASAIAIALGIQVVTATLIGAILPLTAARLKLDPAVIASPALTTVVDITGLLIYFVTAKIILGI